MRCTTPLWTLRKFPSQKFRFIPIGIPEAAPSSPFPRGKSTSKPCSTA